MPSATQGELGAQSGIQTSNRLYISPWNVTLANTVLTPAQQAVANNISYYTIPTFPEKGYGYVELPVEEAQKLLKKFNGSILKGMKVRVEEAKPESKKRKAKEQEDRGPSAAEKEAHKAKKAKKEKLENGVLSGIELPDGREVKRGWVQPSTSEKEKSKSKKSNSGGKGGKKEKSQMIFRTTLPLNVVTPTTDAKVKKQKEKEKKRTREGEKAGLATEVQEFTHSTKFPTFLRGAQAVENGSKATEFVEGKGWVNAAGEVVEEVKIRPQRRVTAPPEPSFLRTKKKSKKTAPVLEESSDLSESSSDPSSESDNDDKDENKSNNEAEPDGEVTHKPSEVLKSPQTASDKVLTLPQPEETDSSPSTTTSPPAESAAPKAIHPLEALYKRSSATIVPISVTSTPRPAPILTNFSFFGEEAIDKNDDDNDAVTEAPIQDENSDGIPKTPYTRRDLESRGQRSAAPTPDTAAVGKKAPWLADRDSSDISSDSSSSNDNTSSDEDDITTPKASATMQSVKYLAAAEAVEAPPREQTEFEKHFWEKRGEYNRSWKQRKREAKKESRQSENRRRGPGVGVFASGRE